VGAVPVFREMIGIFFLPNGPASPEGMKVILVKHRFIIQAFWIFQVSVFIMLCMD
jgi:hypothetical protein